MEPPAKRRRVSKNKKKTWRKHTDVTDVEDYLEDKRLQERTGGLVSEKSDDQLFFVDKVVKPTEEPTVPKRKRKEPKPLKCHANLLPDPNIKPVTIAHNVRTDNPKRISERVKQKKSTVSRTERNALEERKKTLKMKQQAHLEKRKRAVDMDLWGDVDINSNVNNEDEHYRLVTKKRRVNVPSHFHQKPSVIPAVEVVHPGASYNPTYNDYQNLLSKAHTVEVKKLKEEQKLERALDAKFPSHYNEEETFMQEMSVGIFDEDEEESTSSDEEKDGEEEDDDDDELKLSVNPPVRREDKKTVTQRNKEKNRLLALKKVQQEKEDRKKKADMFRIKSIKAEAAKMEKLTEERMNRRKARAEAMATKTKKLGRLVFEEPEIEVTLSEDLAGTLRGLKPEGNLVEDRFKSLQKRNIIEPRKRANRVRKYKEKQFEKKGHKAVTL